jgi:hypothetical protein
VVGNRRLQCEELRGGFIIFGGSAVEDKCKTKEVDYGSTNSAG